MKLRQLRYFVRIVELGSISVGMAPTAAAALLMFAIEKRQPTQLALPVA